MILVGNYIVLATSFARAACLSGSPADTPIPPADLPRLDGMLTDEVEPFDDELGEQGLEASIHAHTTIPTALDERPDNWLITLEGHSYNIAMQDCLSLEGLATQVQTYAAIFSPGHPFPHLDDKALAIKLAELHKSHSRLEQEARAIAKFKDFIPPDEMLTRDSVELQQLGSLDALIRARQATIQPQRFNEIKARAVFGSDDDIERIASIANGAHFDLPVGFVRTVTAPPNRPIQQRIPKVFMAHAHKLWKAGHALFLDNAALAVASDHADIHNNQAHWTPQPRKEEGRFLVDPSNAADGLHVLNSHEAKQLGRERYGAAKYPTIRSLATQWGKLIAQSGRPMREFSFYKDDWVNAFGQVTLDPESAKLMCMPIGDRHTLLQFTGNFGHCSLPAIFYTGLSSPTIRHIQPLIKGVVDGYCDDHAGLSHDSTVHADKAIGQQILRAVVGADVVCEKKDMAPAKEAVIIGYHVSTLTGLTRPPEAACDKLLLVFIACDVSLPHPLRFWELAAGLAERYSWILVGMRSFVQPFHHMKNVVGTGKGHKKLANSAAKQILH